MAPNTISWGWWRQVNTPKIKKRGVPRHHENMLPGNSFPQICVVSVNSIVDNVMSAQEYLKVVA
jgi:hypothetical protein